MPTIPMRTMPVLAADAAGYDVAAKRRRGIVAGVALSLLLHGLLIFGYRSASPPAPVPVPNRAMTVWIQTVPPRIREEIQKPDVAAPVPQLAPRAKPAPPRTRRTERTPLEKAAASRPAPAQAITLPAPATDPSADLRPAAPHLDMDAARKTARAMADEPDPGHAPGTLAAQLDKHPLYQQSEQDKLAREMGGAKRPNCKDGIPGGLLAPLFLLLDKKDSGCKW